ncbi:unnamed protein product [Blumeria hordei]|uniref:DNA polymerase delta subunit 3 n=1 Tax=Blumeria hordei TaxID=2867405 RepID=A0A383UZX6_BLUHO|nr:unnamed protein product [Blumeria hordei]
MLYEFHRVQNQKNPGSIHATYLISGVRRDEVASQSLAKKPINVDNFHPSSSYLCSSSPPPEDTQKIPVMTISLVREEILDEERSKYETLNAIHVYSISQQALKLQDVQVLSDVSREVQEICGGKDQIEIGSKYGSIKSKDVRRRTGVRMVASAQDPPNKNNSSSFRTGSGENVTAITTKTKIKPTQPPAARDFFDRGQNEAKDVTAMAVPINHSGPPSTNKIALDLEPPKSDSSAIFKAFSKSKPKTKVTQGNSSNVKILSPGIIEDESIIDEMETSDDNTKVSAPLINQAVDRSQKSKKEREEALRKMMDDDDDNDNVVDNEEPTSVVDIKNVENSNSTEKTVKVKDENPTTNNPRKRSRRRIMKKTTFKDEEGFLVTKEEPAWESFSEDEQAPALKPKSHPSTMSKSKKGVGGKPVQGNIMSFFGKK